MAPKECPKCAAHPMYGDIWSTTDQLCMDFEAYTYGGWLHTLYYCKRCDFTELKEHDPELIHDGVEEE